MLGRPPPPRRALLAATLGALYGLLILPAPATLLGITLYGAVWFLLAVGLLFTLALSYHVYVFWGLLWVVWRAIVDVRAGELVTLALDAALPLASLALLMTSGYLEHARAARGSEAG